MSFTKPFRVRRFKLLFVLGIGGFALAGRAQTLPGLGGSVQLVPQGSPIPRILPPAPPVVAAPAPAAPVHPAGPLPAQDVRIASVAVEGVTAFPAAKIVPLVGGLTGPAVPLARIEAAREAILNTYRSSGYILSAVSATLNAAGALRFLVTEGRIASVKLSGDIGPAGTQVLRFLKRLTEKRPIDAATLERYLLLAQDVPGVRLHAVLQPSPDEPGAVNLIAQVSRAPVSALVTFDNAASPYTGPYEGLAVADFNSFTALGEQTELSLYHAFPNTETFGQVSEGFYIGASGLQLKVYAGYGNTIPGSIFETIGYQGLTTVFGGQLSYPVIRARQQTLDVVGTFDALESAISTTATGVRATSSYDSVRAFRAGLSWARSDILLGPSRPAVNTALVRASQGLSGILGASTNDGPNLPRAGERPGFFKINGQLSRTQTLFALPPRSNVALKGLAIGQWSPDILPPAEEFYLGGLQINRGYYSGEVTGDIGVALSAELQLNTSFNLTKFGLGEVVNAQFYTFYDWGQSWQNSANALNAHLASAGGGVRLYPTSSTELDLEAAERLNRYPAGSGAGISALKGTAFFFQATVRY